MAEDLCAVVGVVNRNPINKEVDKGCVMRIRVQVDVSLPLFQGRVFSLDDGSKCWVSFKYDCLPNICYWCGKLNHFNKDYDLWIESNGTMKQSDQQYGLWIRASPISIRKNMVPVVLGYYEPKRKERAASNTNGDKPPSSEPSHFQNTAEPLKQGGANNSNPLEVPNQKLNASRTVTEGLMSTAFIGDDSNASLIREVPENKGEYFNTRTMEIDQELQKADLHMGGNLGLDTFEEIQNEPNPVMAVFDEGIQLSSNLIVMQDKFTEHAPHVPLKIIIP